MERSHKRLRSESPLPATRKTAWSGLSVLRVDEDIEKELECPGCQNIPVPPIFTCETGHIVCHKCKKTLNECSVCGKSYTSSRNFQLESNVKSTAFRCLHEQNGFNGCNQELTAEQFADHHQICQFKPMKCHMSGSNDCKGSELYLSEYASHLKDIHKLNTLNCVELWKNRNIFVEHRVDEQWGGGFLGKNHKWTGSSCLLQFNEKTFVTQGFCRGTTFYFGLSLIGEQSEAELYAVKITVQKSAKDKTTKCELTTIVSSIRDVQEMGGSEGPPYVAVHKDLLETLGQICPVEEDSSTTLKWVVIYEIKLVQTSDCYVM